MQTPRWQLGNRNGAALLLLTVMIAFVVIPITGLAIDGGLAYLAQTRLSAACDAAALAGVRALSVGSDLSTQLNHADSAIRAYLQTNFPSNLYRTSNLVITTDIRQTAYKTRTVTVSAATTMPTVFLGIVREPTATISASSQSTRRDVNIMLVLDRSGLMQSAGACETLRASAQTFANKFTNGRDRLGLVTFTVVPGLDYPPALDFKSASPSLDGVLSQMKCGGDSGSAHALWMAYTQLQAINQPGVLNLIVFFSGRMPNGLSADFPVKRAPDTGTRYGLLNPALLDNVPASSCRDSVLSGAISRGSGNAALGYTSGVFSIAPPPLWDTSNPLLNAPGCAFSSGTATNMRADVAYIPGVDINGNSTVGTKQVGVYPNGPYAGQMRVDVPTTITAASQNATENAARRIRSDRSLAPVIYSIGLGGTSNEALDQDFLRRVANDANSSAFDPSQPQGLFVYASNATQLNNAFNTVASRIRDRSR